jgi:bifunctional DNA-binding transcriptional regulator/antitoxin component of YhaV-PrlF toxin-antitoxin module
MIDITITKLSSKGQAVIPSEMRVDFGEGEKLVIIKNGEQSILKKASDPAKNFADDLAFARRTEEALKRYENGLFKELNTRDFTNELEKW